MDLTVIFCKIAALVLCSAITVLSGPLKDDASSQEIALMHSYMNTSINPCENFYEYSCGSWLETHSEVIKDPVNELDHIYNIKLKNLLDEADNDNGDSILKRLRIFYKTCKARENFDIESYISLMANESRPVHNEVIWNIWKTMGELYSIGVKNIFFDIMWQKDIKTDYHLSLSSCSKYNFNVKSESLDNVTKEFLDTLQDLCEKYPSKSSQLLTLPQLQKEIPNIDFLSYFLNLFQDTSLPLDIIKIEVNNIDYLRNLGDLIQKTSPNTLRHILKYFLSQFLKENQSRDCFSTMRDLLPLALNVVYDKYIYKLQKSKSDKIVQQIFGNLQMQFENILKRDSDKFTLEEQRFLNDKITKMELNIGNLQLNANEDFYNRYYDDWKAEPGKHYKNLLQALRHKKLEDLGVYSFLLKFSPTFENVLQVFYPFYLFPKNVMVVPFQYLTYPEFQTKFNSLLLYGDLGYSMSHAMMYGFSPFGLQYSAEGDRNITLAQTLLGKPPLNDSIKCLNVSHSYEDDIKMTDFIGFRLAYETYFETIPDANTNLDDILTNRQLFYLRFSQSECIVRRLPTYTELPESIQNVVQNGRDFEEIFGCPQETNKHNKCDIW